MHTQASKIYIAVIEDDESLGRSLSRLLQAYGYQPVSYLSAEAFLNDEKQPVFDCLIVDVQLGGMSGIELVKQLAHDTAMPPVIYLTAHEEWELLRQGIDTQHTVLLRKTDMAEVVIATVQSSLHHVHLQEHPGCENESHQR